MKQGVKYYRAVQTASGECAALIERVPDGLAISSIARPDHALIVRRDETVPLEVQIKRDLEKLAVIAAHATASATGDMTRIDAGAILSDDANRLLERGAVATLREAHRLALKRNPLAARAYSGCPTV